MREHDMGSLDSLSGCYMFRPFPYSIPFNSLALFSHQKERDEMLFFFWWLGCCYIVRRKFYLGLWLYWLEYVFLMYHERRPNIHWSMVGRREIPCKNMKYSSFQALGKCHIFSLVFSDHSNSSACSSVALGLSLYYSITLH